MPFGLGWEDPDPDASSGIGGDDEATAVEVAAASKTAASSAPPPPRNNSKKSGTRSDGRKTSTTRGSSGGGSSKRKTKSSQDASGVAAAAAAAAAPEAAEDDKPSPHKSRRHRSSRDGSGKNTSSAKGGAPAPPPRPRSSPRASSSGKHRSSGSRSRSSTKQASTRTRSSKSGGGTRTSSSGSRPSGSPRSSPRTSPRSSPGRDRNKTSMDSNTAAAAMAAATAAAGGAVVGAALVSPTETENTKESSHDSWRENGCDDAHDDIEAGGAASPRASSSPAKRSYKDKSGSGRQSGSGSRSKSAGKSGSRSKSSGGGKGGSSSGRHQSRNSRSSSNNRHHQSSGGKSGGRSSSRRQTSRSRRKYDYVSCCGWEWKKTHLLFLVVAVILIAGGAVAALLFTGILGGGSSSQASDFSSVTNSPTAVPVPRPTWSDNGGNRPVASDQNQNQQPAATAPVMNPRPTSCTETTGLFKYFDDVGIVVTTNCKKVALSTEADEVKCQRTIVFGGGYIVRDICPVTCGECSGEDEGLVPTEKPTAFTLEPTPAPKPVAIPTLASPGFASHETFSFYVMGDIPYLFKQDLTLIEQLQDQTNTLDPKKEIFQVHVGDIQNPKRTQCASSHYDKIAGYYKTYSKLPNLILPGDNDWNDCPNPDQAWQYWQNNFVPFEQYWSDTSDFPSTVMRQAGQQENFAFTRGGVLFLGLNLVGGQTNAYVTEADWDRKIDNDIAWAEFHMDRLNVGSPRADPMDEDYIRAVIIFGHSPRGRRFNNFLMQRLYNSNLPVVYLHGNGHTYMAVQPFLSDGWSNYWRIQVDQGFNAPPVKVTVRGTTPEALRSSMSINGGKVFPGGFIKLDRRGGLYDGAVATDADGNPLISGVGG